MTETIEFFGEYKNISTILHVLSVVVGMGSAFVSDIFFNIFIKDKKIQKYENKILNRLSSIVWISLLFILLTGLMLFLSDPLGYSMSVKFLIKMTVVGLIAVNGYVFLRIVHPALHKMNFSDNNIHHKYVRLRKVSFALGAISFVSWLSAFLLGILPNIPLSYAQSLIGYLVLCFVGIIMSQIIEDRTIHE